MKFDRTFLRSRAIWLTVAGVLPLLPVHANAEDWVVRRETSSGACHVQLKTAAKLGNDLSGPFTSRKDACNDAAKKYDDTATDSKKCGTYGKGTIDGCKKENVTLPPKK